MKIVWNKVTWYSKLLTVIFLVIVLPALAIYIEIQFRNTFVAYSTFVATPSIKNSTSSEKGTGCSLLPDTSKIPFNYLDYYYLDNNDLRGGMICKFVINPTLPVFTFHFVGQSDNTLGNVEITEGDSDQVIQTISNTTDSSTASTNAESVLTTADANFDGYEDLMILNGCGTTGNCLYGFYIYDPETNNFVYDNFLSKLTNPSFDYDKNQIATAVNVDAYDFKSDTYQYQDGEYTLVRKEISTLDQNSNTVTKKIYELGKDLKMELTSSVTTPSSPST